MTDGRRTSARAGILALALLQALYLAAAVRLHPHGAAPPLALDALPAEYHHHDYGFAEGRDFQRGHSEDCLGCRLERSPVLPGAPAPRYADAVVARVATPPALLETVLPASLRLARAPPRA